MFLLFVKLRQVDKLAASLTVCNSLGQALAASRSNPLAHKDVRDSYAKRDTHNGDSRTHTKLHRIGKLAHNTVHLNQSHKSAIHQHTWNHWDDTRDREHVMRNMELVYSLDTYKRNQRTARKRTNGKTHILEKPIAEIAAAAAYDM